MAKPKKDYIFMSVKLARDVAEMLNVYAKEHVTTKTAVIEEALKKLISN